jgi:hypothetical protein
MAALDHKSLASQEKARSSVASWRFQNPWIEFGRVKFQVN